MIKIHNKMNCTATVPLVITIKQQWFTQHFHKNELVHSLQPLCSLSI